MADKSQGIVVGTIDDLAKQGSISFAPHEDARRSLGRQVDTALRSSEDDKSVIRLAWEAPMAMQRRPKSDSTEFPELGIGVSEVTDAELADSQRIESGTRKASHSAHRHPATGRRSAQVNTSDSTRSENDS